ncbi:hypothetical protein Tco_0989951 [Tanacetum coccineum]|uniref:Uncharacterized protein n=1 Tax=Tanacetum coccineum TaxID=301880 RepID=A0ABQ5EWP0_9ASTR
MVKQYLPGYDKSKGKSISTGIYNGTFARECRATTMSTRQQKFGIKIDWSDMAEAEIQANEALMASPDSELDDTGLKRFYIPKRGRQRLEKFFSPANQVREEEPKKSRENNDAPIIKDWVSDDEDCPNVHKHMAPRAVLMKTGLKTVNTARPVKSVRSVNTVRPFSTARQNVNTVKARGFNVVKPSAYWVWKTHQTQLDAQGTCLWNIAHLSDSKTLMDVYVTLLEEKMGKLLGANVTIKTDNLDLKNVYFCQRLRTIVERVAWWCASVGGDGEDGCDGVGGCGGCSGGAVVVVVVMVMRMAAGGDDNEGVDDDDDDMMTRVVLW